MPPACGTIGGMRRLRTLLFALLLAGLATGCGRGPDVDADATLPGLDAGEGAVEWRGSLPCADCQAIDTRLVLAGHTAGIVFAVRQHISKHSEIRKAPLWYSAPKTPCLPSTPPEKSGLTPHWSPGGSPGWEQWR